MAVSAETKVLGINDAKISKLLTDTSIETTYNAPIDVPGIQSLKVNPKFLEKELKGDEQILDVYSKLVSVDWSFEGAKISLPALAVLMGGTVISEGTTPAGKQTYNVKTTDRPPFFKIEGQSTYTDAGDIHVILHKCKASKVDYELKGEDYAVVSASGRGIGTTFTGDIKDIIINEMITAIIAGDSDSIPPTISSSVPTVNETGVATSSTYALTMSESLNPATVTGSNFYLVDDTDGTLVPGTVTYNDITKIVTLTPTSALSALTKYLVIVDADVTDVAGNHIVPTTRIFTTL